MAQNSGQNGLAHSLANFTVGPFPLPVYLGLAAIVFLSAYLGKLPADMIGGFAVMMALGVLLGDIGMRVPVLKDIGGPAILSIFVPSIMIFYGLLGDVAPPAIKALTAGKGGANFLYFYIATLVCGSILGMVRAVLIQGFLRMFVPLLIGTIASVAAGVAVGVATGIGAYDSLFFVVVPIISGGIGEGILPLSVGYAEILGGENTGLIAKLVPAAMLGNITAIMLAGFLKKLAQKKPHLSGNGNLVRTKSSDDDIMHAKAEEQPLNVQLMGIGMLTACCFYLFGGVLNTFIPIPAPIIMIIAAAAAKALNIMPKIVEQGAYQFYLFVSKNLTWALLVGVGVLYTPWKDVVAAISPAYILTCVSTVVAMVASGFFIGKYLNMYPIESAVITGCHSGLGGTGDVAILSAFGHMELIPFAQISTRIGGACVVVGAIILLRMVH